MNIDNELLPRTSLLDEFGISDSSERRLRKEGTDWPPHVLIGRKVYYRRASLAEWLRTREAGALPPDTGWKPYAERVTAALRKVNVLAESAPPLTAAQAHRLHRLLPSDIGGEVR